MKNGIIYALFWLILQTQALAEIRIMSWNLQNYLLSDRMVEGVYLRNYPKPEVEKAALRQFIIEQDPDILVMQEIGDVSFLRELQNDLAKDGLFYPDSAHLQADDTSRCLAVLSRIPWTESIGHGELSFNNGGQTTLSRRGLLEVVFDHNNIRWHLFNFHLKSRFTVDNTDPEAAQFRNSEAHSIRQKIRQRTLDNPDALFLIMGDANDHPRSAPVQRLTKIGQRTFSVMLPATDDRKETWTWHHPAWERYERIDYALVSPAMLPLIKDQKAWLIASPIQSTASDHRAIILTLNVPPSLMTLKAHDD